MTAQSLGLGMGFNAEPTCPIGMLQGLAIPPPSEVLPPPPAVPSPQLKMMQGDQFFNGLDSNLPPPLMPSSKQFLPPPTDPASLSVPLPDPSCIPLPWQKGESVPSLAPPPAVPPKEPKVKQESMMEDFKKILTDLVGPKKEDFQNIPNELVGELKEMQQGVSRLAGTSKKLLEFGVSARLNKLDELSRVEEEKLTTSQLAEKRRLVRLEKNRRAASVSRERKRSYVRSLEERSLIMAKHLAALETENAHLRQMMRQQAQGGGTGNDLILPPGSTPNGGDMSMMPPYGASGIPGMPGLPMQGDNKFKCPRSMVNTLMKKEPVPAALSPPRPGRRKRKASRSRTGGRKKRATMSQRKAAVSMPMPSAEQILHSQMVTFAQSQHGQMPGGIGAGLALPPGVMNAMMGGMGMGGMGGGGGGGGSGSNSSVASMAAAAAAAAMASVSGTATSHLHQLPLPAGKQSKAAQKQSSNKGASAATSASVLPPPPPPPPGGVGVGLPPLSSPLPPLGNNLPPLTPLMVPPPLMIPKIEP